MEPQSQFRGLKFFQKILNLSLQPKTNEKSKNSVAFKQLISKRSFARNLEKYLSFVDPKSQRQSQLGLMFSIDGGIWVLMDGYCGVLE